MVTSSIFGVQLDQALRRQGTVRRPRERAAVGVRGASGAGLGFFDPAGTASIASTGKRIKLATCGLNEEMDCDQIQKDDPQSTEMYEYCRAKAGGNTQSNCFNECKNLYASCYSGEGEVGTGWDAENAESPM